MLLKVVGALAIVLIVSNSTAYAAEKVDMQTYTCRQFLADVAKPDTGGKLIRPLMAISWAAGYAAAHQSGTIRADATAFQLIASGLGDSCKTNPDLTVTAAAVDAVRKAMSSK